MEVQMSINWLNKMIHTNSQNGILFNNKALSIELGMVAHIRNPSYFGRIRQEKDWKFKARLGSLARPSLKIKLKERKKEVSIGGTTLTTLENIMLSKSSQTSKVIFIIPII